MGDAAEPRPTPKSHAPDTARAERIARLQTYAQALILMKETGPKSAAWHRARVRTLWRLQQQIAELEHN
jgi:hypothetical protein